MKKTTKKIYCKRIIQKMQANKIESIEFIEKYIMKLTLLACNPKPIKSQIINIIKLFEFRYKK